MQHNCLSDYNATDEFCRLRRKTSAPNVATRDKYRDDGTRDAWVDC